MTLPKIKYYLKRKLGPNEFALIPVCDEPSQKKIEVIKNQRMDTGEEKFVKISELIKSKYAKKPTT